MSQIKINLRSRLTIVFNSTHCKKNNKPEFEITVEEHQILISKLNDDLIEDLYVAFID